MKEDIVKIRWIDAQRLELGITHIKRNSDTSLAGLVQLNTKPLQYRNI